MSLCSCQAQVQVIPAGSETTMFKQFFFKWLEGEATGKTYTVGRIAKVEQIPFDSSKLHSNKAMAAQHGMVDDGSGKVQVGFLKVCLQRYQVTEYKYFGTLMKELIIYFLLPYFLKIVLLDSSTPISYFLKKCNHLI